jgi:hypothetical protein
VGILIDMKNIKTLLYIALLSQLVVSCSSITQIGKVNMISNRNIDPNLMEYELLTTYVGGSKKEIKRSKALSIEEAIDQTVRSIPGGEFIMNAKIYLVNGEYFVVEGDVWGTKENIMFKGFKVGDKVTWRESRAYKTGVITSLKDDRTCLIKLDNNEVIEKKYDDITKSN